MTGTSSISGGTCISSTALQIEFNTKIANLQKNAQQLEGDLALQLIQSATIQGGTGQQLDVIA